MNTTRTQQRVVTAAIGAAIAGMAAPALLFLGAGTGHAAQVVTEHGAATITQSPGHVAIYTKPQEVTSPIVWGPFPSVEAIIAK
jgi:hypothetical protein